MNNQYLSDRLTQLLIDWGITYKPAVYLKLILLIALMVALGMLLHFFGRKVVLRIVKKLSESTETKFDDFLVERGVFRKFSHLFPIAAVYLLNDFILTDFPELTRWVLGATNIYLIIILMLVLSAATDAIRDYLFTKENLKNKPLTSYGQLVKIVNYALGGILIISVLIGKSPLYLLTGIGALTAVLLLVFKDTILGLVASIQISANDLVRVGDWVDVPKYGADGSVLEINLATIKVRNWDNTISTVPTYAFISDSFKNWRGMAESGGRRIKRAIKINQQSIKFLSYEQLEKLKKIQLIKAYLEEKQVEIEKHNAQTNADKTVLGNGRNLTNIGVFRKYAELYLFKNKNLNHELTTMVRLLEPNENGLPLEIYCFSKDKTWVNYERIIADILDHLLAVIPQFELEIFQNPSGSDFKQLSSIK